MKEPEISIIIPVYNEEGNLKILCNQIKNTLSKYNKHYEIIFIDDGSTDSSFKILQDLHGKNKNVAVVKFRKNFGQTAAIDAGFKHARGNILVVMDSDLQNDPEDIPRLIEALNQGYDAVSGWRYDRKDPVAKKIVSFFSNTIRRLLTNDKIHDSGCSLKAYRKECVKDLDLYGEMHRYIPALLSWKGFRIGEIKVHHHPRKSGKTKYGAVRIIKGLLDLLVVKFWMQYSARPIHLFGTFGLLSFFFGTLIGIYLVIEKFFYGRSLANRPLLMLAVLTVIIGIQFILFGVLADIMIKIYYTGREKTPYSIEKKLDSKK